MGAMRIQLDAALSPLGATIVTDGRSAWFDLAGLPRVDAQLVGRPAASVPPLVERLCGICPVPHHLAGLTALEALTGTGPIPPAALATRRLLLYASTVDQLALRLAQIRPAAVRPLRQVARAGMTAAGSPGHFPTTGVPGGVRELPSSESLAGLAAAIEEALALALGLADDAAASDAARHVPAGLAVPAARSQYTGLDACLVDEQGHPDLMGTFLRAVDARGEVVLAGATTEDWPRTGVESRPGSTTPRPVLRLPGDPEGHPGHPYRVGPLAHLRVGRLSTPLAVDRQEDWLARYGCAGEGTLASDALGSGAMEARAILLIHALEVVGCLVRSPERFAGEAAVLAGDAAALVEPATGTGWVESPRGLLVHSYTAGPDGLLTAAQVLTPTVQTETWLAEMLTHLPGLIGTPASTLASENTSLPEAVRQAVENAVQDADPCLPCVSAPAGTMSVTLTRV